MSVESEILRIQRNIANAYTAVASKGGVVPQQPTSDELPAAVGTIPSNIGISLASLAITTPPNKTAYLAGEVFDPAGMVVTAVFSSGETVDVTGLPISPSGPLSAADTQITLSMALDDQVRTAVQPITVSAAQIFGVMWDSSSPSTALTRLTKANDPNGLVTTDITAEPSAAVGAEDGASQFDSYLPWKDMEEYNIIDGAVSRKRGDAGFSRTDYDTVVYIPAFWYKVVKSGGNWCFYIANGEAGGFEQHPGSGKYVGRYNTGENYVSKTGIMPLRSVTRAAARTGSAAKGSGWRQYDFASWNAVWLLYLVEFADWDSQAKIGMGNVNTDSVQPNGGTDNMTCHTGRAFGEDGNTQVQYRHIENPWGNIWEWIDGINFSDRRACLCTNPADYADDTTDNYTDSGITLPANGWIKGLGLSGSFPWAFLPSDSGGSETTFIPDYVSSGSGFRILMAGGNYAHGSESGLLNFHASNPSTYSSRSIGGRLLYDPEVVTV